ncbi:HmuY family protein [Pseudenhygromyxa sp. WMMC2535]|uniref:HmuY family protein n=1 Tax=Pseudenhygromyxa sp. WMMC2535 TaxID=2712867 RepID=UPI00155573C2|nr:HmuY family protein [Pseudenhygromyxa sp. WMMC2535]NVB39885.1 HmuY family protein [Pseudenhygromyxa sp. WMMC2535]
MHRKSNRPNFLPLLPALLIAGLAQACVEDIGFDDEDQGEDETADTGEDAGEHISSSQDGEVTTSLVDASSESDWVYFDLDGSAEVTDADAWELGLRRFEIIVNGGISGDAGVEVAILEGVDLDEVDAAPEDAEWVTDAVDADDDGTDELVFIDWYDYDFTTHLLSPKQRVYVVRSSEGADFGVQIDGYYSEAGTSGVLTLRWKPLG